MTFEYHDQYGHTLTADHGLDDDNNPMAVLWSRGKYGARVPVRIPAGRVEEVVTGIRDAARQATGDTEMAASLRRHGFGDDEITDIMQRPIARTLTLNEHDRAWHAIEHAAGQDDADPGTVLAAVLRALRINAPSVEDEQAASPRRRDATCQATGQPTAEAVERCGTCRGSGLIADDPHDATAEITQCQHCHGTGHDTDHPNDCPGCAPTTADEGHRPPCVDGNHCGEAAHCPPPSAAYTRLQAAATKTNREMAAATLRAYKRVYQLASTAAGPIDPIEILDALKDPEPDPARLLAALTDTTPPTAAGAAPTNPDTETEAHPPRVTWHVEGYDADEWNPCTGYHRNREDALQGLKNLQHRYPGMPTRVVRETTTWTVEDTPRAAGAES